MDPDRSFKGAKCPKVLLQGPFSSSNLKIPAPGQQTKRLVCAYSAGVLVGFVNVLAGRQDVVCVERACQAQGAEVCLFELLPAEVAGDLPVVALSSDLALERQLNLLEVLFERMPMGIVILDRDLRMRRFNPTWAEFVDRYSPVSVSQVLPGVSFFDLVPGAEAAVKPIFKQILAGETVRQEGFRLKVGNIVSYWDAVITPLIENGQVVGIVHVTTDATERVLAHQELEARVEARTRELATLLQVSHDVGSTLELQPLLDLILDQLRTVVDYDGASILTLENDDLVVQAYRGPIPKEEARQLRFPLEKALVNRQVIRQRKPIVIPNIRSDTPLAHMFRQTAGGELETIFGYVRSWLGVPLMVKGKMLGMLTLDHSQSGFFTARHADLVLTFANQVAVAMENARLYEQAEESAATAERQRLARELHDAVTQTLFSASLIAEVLPRLWEQDRDEGWRRLEELRQLTRGALAEMRTLLLELRPATLTETALGDLLRQLTESIIGRARVPVKLEVDGKWEPPAEVKVALYRIAQEALNNVAKHADATQVVVSLHCTLPSSSQGEGPRVRVELSVSDDGLGFDPEDLSPEHLGLGIMRERAEAIGAKLRIDSQLGHGTQVTVVWPAVTAQVPGTSA
jgi:signal transduction histidine kinase/PAS domain-containing protein